MLLAEIKNLNTLFSSRVFVYKQQTGKKNLIELLERGNKHTLDADSRGRRVLNMLLFRE